MTQEQLSQFAVGMHRLLLDQEEYHERVLREGPFDAAAARGRDLAERRRVLLAEINRAAVAREERATEEAA